MRLMGRCAFFSHPFHNKQRRHSAYSSQTIGRRHEQVPPIRQLVRERKCPFQRAGQVESVTAFRVASPWPFCSALAAAKEEK